MLKEKLKKIRETLPHYIIIDNFKKISYHLIKYTGYFIDGANEAICIISWSDTYYFEFIYKKYDVLSGTTQVVSKKYKYHEGEIIDVLKIPKPIKQRYYNISKQ